MNGKISCCDLCKHKNALQNLDYPCRSCKMGAGKYGIIAPCWEFESNIDFKSLNEPINKKLYVYTEKQEDINKWHKGVDLTEIYKNYETYSDIKDLLEDAYNSCELIMKKDFEYFYVVEIDQNKNKLIGVNKYKVIIRIEKVG